MHYVNYGEKGKKILIIHGWTHSSKRYIHLAKELSSTYNVTLLDLPGFGMSKKLKCKKNLIEALSNEVKTFLENNKFDLLIGHSLGAAILLRIIYSKDINISKKVILLNPPYNGISYLKLPSILVYMNYGLFKLQSFCPRWLAKPFIKIVALLSINTYKLIDDILIDDVRNSNSWYAAQLFKELAWDNWEVKDLSKSRIVKIVKSEKDRLINRRNIEKLKNDIGADVIELKGIGHTTVVEAYEDLKNYILNIAKEV